MLFDIESVVAKKDFYDGHIFLKDCAIGPKNHILERGDN